MPHPTDATLNEYLDGTLPPGAEAPLAHHLAACPACAARCTTLRAVFAALEDLPEAPLHIDLAARVVAHLPSPLTTYHLPPFIQWLAALQVAGLFAVLVFSWPVIETTLNFNFPMPVLTWELGLTPLFAAWSDLWLRAPTVSVLPFDPFLAALAVGSVAALWLVGNGLLLRPHSRK